MDAKKIEMWLAPLRDGKPKVCKELDRYEANRVCGKPATAFVIRYSGFQIVTVCQEHEAYYRKLSKTTNGMEVAPIEQSKPLRPEGGHSGSGDQEGEKDNGSEN